jgi:hypothetical protein
MIDAIRKDPVGIEFNYSSSSTVHQISAICGAAFEDQQIPDSVQIAPPPKSGNPMEKKLAWYYNYCSSFLLSDWKYLSLDGTSIC